MEELVSVVFSNATYEQQKLMLQLIEAENMRSYMQLGLRITFEDVRTLFGKPCFPHVAELSKNVVSSWVGLYPFQPCMTKKTLATFQPE